MLHINFLRFVSLLWLIIKTRVSDRKQFYPLKGRSVGGSVRLSATLEGLDECEVACKDKSYSEHIQWCVHIWLRAWQIGLSTWVESYKSDTVQFCLSCNRIIYTNLNIFSVDFLSQLSYYYGRGRGHNKLGGIFLKYCPIILKGISVLLFDF